MRDRTSDVWEAMSTARSVRRFTDEPVDDETLRRCIEAATWAPNGANAQLWRFVVLDAPEQRSAVATAAQIALGHIELAYGMGRPAGDDRSRAARNNRATYELHDYAGNHTSVLFTAFKHEFAPEYLQAGSIYPAMQNFYLAARAQGLGACFTSWASYDGEQLLRDAVGVPHEWVLAGHIVIGWPRGHHGRVRRRPVADVMFRNRWDSQHADILHGGGARPRGSRGTR
ncbi:nitroreductase [Mycobacterium colombiense]|uniref:nitroreductase family protein n=1 Tax=Mycobacterium colombiense TaxID=339268 RepID=UPI0007EF9120|nr:nitroreductase family protein [Mycobacterium colombiense]OBK64269.1 nitroreductase [Mycobacterium colombiense]